MNNSGSTQIGSLGSGGGVQAVATDFSTGAMQQTGNALDVALTGDAYLTVQTPSGIYYTRDGALTRNAQGQLTQASGGALVLDPGNRPITIPGKAKSIVIDKAGEIFADGVPVGALNLVAVNKTTKAVKIGSNLFQETTVRPASLGSTVQQGFLEASNVNVVKEMVNMIATMRAYETNEKILQAEDNATNKAVNDVAKV